MFPGPLSGLSLFRLLSCVRWTRRRRRDILAHHGQVRQKKLWLECTLLSSKFHGWIRAVTHCVFVAQIAPFIISFSFVASGASVGLPLHYEVDRDNFFSERSMVKLLSNEDGEFLYESDVGGLNNNLKFHKLKTDILIPEGDNAGLTLDIQELLISGRINATGEVDFYRFAGKKGEVISAEFNGFDIYPWDEHDVVIGALNLYRENKDGAWTLVASNHQNFEGFDAFMVGALLEEDGNYIVQVFAPDVLHFGYGDFMSLDLYGFSEFCQGDYYLSIYKIDAKAQ